MANQNKGKIVPACDSTVPEQGQKTSDVVEIVKFITSTLALTVITCVAIKYKCPMDMNVDGCQVSINPSENMPALVS